jgi:hypothetical protein
MNQLHDDVSHGSHPQNPHYIALISSIRAYQKALNKITLTRPEDMRDVALKLIDLIDELIKLKPTR